VEFSAVQMSCPAGNLHRGRSVNYDSGSPPALKCRVCGIEHLEPDSDMHRGYWAGRIAWGPNQYEDTISETEVLEYRVYVVDAQYQRLTERPLAVEATRPWNSLQKGCCDHSAYHVDLVVELPVSSTYFMVVPLTKAGLELNIGPVTTRIEDLGDLVHVAAADMLRLQVTWLLSLMPLFYLDV